MIGIFAKTFMTATRSDDKIHTLTRVRDVRHGSAPSWWRGKTHRRPARYIDLNDL